MNDTFRPLFDRIVVKEVDEPEMRKSGLVLATTQREAHPPQNGIVLAVGPGLDWWGNAGIEMPVRPGDRVVFPFHTGTWIEVEEERLLVLRVGEVLGVLDHPSDRVA